MLDEMPAHCEYDSDRYHALSDRCRSHIRKLRYGICFTSNSNMPEGFRLVFSYGICASFARGGPVWHKKFSVPFNRHSIDGDVSLSVHSEKRPKMYRLMRLVLTTTGLIFSFMAMTLHAAIMTFNVDLSGIDPPSGHNLRVFGTLTVDPVLPILASNTHSSLFFQHNVDTPIVLPSSPNFVTSTDALSWSLLNGDLILIGRATITDMFRGCR